MSPKKTPETWVIFASPRQYGAGTNHYIAADGSVTDQVHKAQQFYSYEGAAEFAKEKKTTLDGVMRYAQRL